jgi:hypothetical protein
MWSVGICMSSVVLPIYFWRLMTQQLPARSAIVTTFVPIGPFGMGAYSIQQLSSDLARCITEGFTLDQALGADGVSTRIIGEGIRWLGIIIALTCLGIASFWLVEACLSVATRPPNSFSVGKIVFGPCPSQSDHTKRLLELCISLRSVLQCLESAEHKFAQRRHEGLGSYVHSSNTVALAGLCRSDGILR